MKARFQNHPGFSTVVGRSDKRLKYGVNFTSPHTLKINDDYTFIIINFQLEAND